MTYKSNPVGNEITCVMYGIDCAVLSDAEKLQKCLLAAAKIENFKILKSAFHRFEPHGFTGILMIQESHIAVHTYPEYNCLVFNLYSCRGPEDGRKALEYFKNQIQPERAEIRENKVVINIAN